MSEVRVRFRAVGGDAVAAAARAAAASLSPMVGAAQAAGAAGQAMSTGTNAAAQAATAAGTAARAATTAIKTTVPAATGAAAAERGRATATRTAAQAAHTGATAARGQARELDRLSPAAQRAGRSLRQVQPPAQQLGGAIQAIGPASLSTALRLGILGSALFAAYKATTFVVGGFVDLGQAIGSALADSVKVAGTFDAAMASVAAKTGATAAEFRALRADALALGASTKFTAVEVGGAQTALAAAGFRPQQIVQSTGAFLDLAAAGDVSIQSAADIGSNIMAPFHLAASEARNVADTLTKTVNATNTNLTELGDAVSYAGGVSRSFGQDLATTSAAAGILANQGIKGSRGGTNIAALLQRIATPEARGSQTLERIGLGQGDIRDASGQLRDLPSVMKALGDRLAKLSLPQQQKALVDIFGQRNINAAQALIDAAQSGEFAALAASLRNARGSAARTAATMQQNVPGAMTRLSSAAEGLRIAIGDQLTGPFGELVDSLTGGVSDLVRTVRGSPELLEGLAQSMRLMGRDLAGFFAELSAHPGRLQALTDGIAQAAQVVGTLALGFARLTLAMGRIAPIVTDFAAAMIRGQSPAGAAATVAARASLGGYSDDVLDARAAQADAQREARAQRIASTLLGAVDKAGGTFASLPAAMRDQLEAQGGAALLEQVRARQLAADGGTGALITRAGLGGDAPGLMPGFSLADNARDRLGITPPPPAPTPRRRTGGGSVSRAERALPPVVGGVAILQATERTADATESMVPILRQTMLQAQAHTDRLAQLLGGRRRRPAPAVSGAAL